MFADFFSQRRRIGITVIALAVLAILGGAVLWQVRRAGNGRTPPAAVLPPVTPPPGTPPAKPPPSTGSGQAPPQSAPAYTGAPAQELHADQEFLKQVPADTYDKSRKELALLAVSLAANPRDASGWMRVAYIKRFYGDYAGARDAYEYVNVIAEGDALPFYNLAGLYGYYLKEPAKAIPKYQAALQRDPMSPDYYIGFADFYREVMQDLPAAERVLERGLAKIPNETNFMISYAALSKAMGKTARAIEYYETVLASAALGAPQRAAITAEVERLKAKNP